MAHNYPNILIHCVFSTTQRRDLVPEEILPRLWKYVAGIGRNHGIPVLAAGGISNHAHLLVALPVDVTVAKAIQVMKANSSRWLHEHGLEFAWQEGDGAFSVSSSNVPAALGPEQPKIISGLHQKWALTGFGHRSSILPSACSELGLGVPRDSPLGFPGSRHPS